MKKASRWVVAPFLQAWIISALMPACFWRCGGIPRRTRPGYPGPRNPLCTEMERARGAWCPWDQKLGTETKCNGIKGDNSCWAGKPTVGERLSLTFNLGKRGE